MADRQDAWHAFVGPDGLALRRSVVVFMLLAGLAGCTRHAVHPDMPANEGGASWQAVEQPGTVHYQLALGEVSSGGTAMQRITPVYPPTRLAACPSAVDVTVKLIVDRAGKVAEVRPGNDTSASAELAPYLDATRAAALRWQFNPLQINRWSADANGESRVVDSRTEPFSLDYLFRFTCHAGHASVSAGDAVQPGSVR